MSVDTYEQMSTGVSDITSIALVTLEIINNSLLINELSEALVRLSGTHGQSCGSALFFQCVYPALVLAFKFALLRYFLLNS